MMRLTFAQVEDLLSGDAARRAVRAATEALTDPARWFPATAVLGCRARRPVTVGPGTA